MIDLDIKREIPANVRALIKRAIRMINMNVEPADREHVAFLISQFLQQGYFVGHSEGLKASSKIFNEEFKNYWRKQ